MKKKLIATITAATILLGGATTTAFAAGNDVRGTIKAVVQKVKENVAVLKSKQGTVKTALENKAKSEGYFKVDKNSVASQFQALKSLKGDIEKIRTDIKAAREAKDKTKLQELQGQLKDKTSQVQKILQDLAPFKEQIQKNKAVRENMKPLKDELNSLKVQKDELINQDATIRNDIKALRDKLKAAVEQNSEEEITNLTNQIVEKLNALNDNITKLNNLQDEAVKKVNGGQ